MSLGDAAAAIHQIAADASASVGAFRATVTDVSAAPLVSIRREGEATGSSAKYATVTRFVLNVSDVVLCLPLGDTPIIIDVIQRASVATGTLVTPTIADFTNATHTHLNAANGGVLTGYQKKDGGYFAAPGPVAIDNTTVTALATQQCGARYLGMVPADVTSVEVNVRVTTAVATSISYAEVALASANSATGGNMTLLGSVTSVTATFNSTGNKTVTFAISVPAGTFLYFLFGSQATTPFQLRGTLPDELGVGVVRLASTTRPSTMAAPTAFSSSTNSTAAAWCIARWS